MNSNDIFDNDLKEKIQLINYLTEDNTWMTTENIVKKIAIEKKTVLKYLTELNNYMDSFNRENNYIDKIYIESYKGRGYHICYFSEEVKEEFLCFLMKDTLILKLLRLLFLENKLNITRASIDLFVSESTIRRKLKKVQPLFKKFNVRIVSKNGIYKLIGEETKVRELGFYLFWRIYKGKYWPFQNINKEKIMNFINKKSEEYGYLLNRQESLKLSFFLSFNLTRYFHNQVVSSANLDKTIREINEKIFYYLNIDKHIQEEFHVPIDEIHFFVLYLQTKEKFYGNQNVLHVVKNEHKRLNTDIEQSTRIIVERLLNTYGDCKDSSINKTKKVIYALIFAVHYAAFVDYGLISNKLEVKKLIDYYPKLRLEMYQLCSVLLDETRISIFRNCEFLVDSYSLCYALLRPINTFEPTINILCETTYSAVKKKVLLNTINNTFSSKYKINVISEDEKKNLSKENIDLEISTNIYTNSEITSIPIIHLRNGLLRGYEITQINNVLEKIYTQKQKIDVHV